MRVYVALPLPETFRAEISARLGALKKENPKYRWLDGQDMRITTNFYGKVDAAGAGLVQSAVKLAAAGFGPFTMSVGSMGINWDLMRVARHVNNTRVAVAWQSLFVRKGIDEMTALADKIDATLAEISKHSRSSFRDRIKRPFKPYITIVRMGRPRESIVVRRNGRTFSRYPFKPAPEYLVQEAAVYVSGRLPDGARRTFRTLVRLG